MLARRFWSRGEAGLHMKSFGVVRRAVSPALGACRLPLRLPGYQPTDIALRRFGGRAQLHSANVGLFGEDIMETRKIVEAHRLAV